MFVRIVSPGSEHAKQGEIGPLYPDHVAVFESRYFGSPGSIHPHSAGRPLECGIGWFSLEGRRRPALGKVPSSF